MVRLEKSLEEIDIAVLCGGPGPERGVSLDSGAAILQGLRDAGMLALDLCPPAKRVFGRLTMGRAGRLPRLARGLAL